ncbi:MAG TPA: addiction module protein [Polyangiaceae bacterium]|nr:addiction module protein [Polyangiaceae bacterium]
MTYEALLDEALALPEGQRAALVQELSASLVSSEVEGAWAAEVTRRVKQLRSGVAETVSADVAVARARAALQSFRG